jgi:alginate O-acetyltransferase complex protein AlgI
LNSLYLFLLMLVCAIAYWNLPRFWRKQFLFGLSAICVAALHFAFALYFLLMILLTHLICREASQPEPRLKPITLLRFALVLLIGNLFFFKYAPFFLSLAHQPQLPFLFPLGLSYITFRLVHYLVEVYRRHIPVASITDLGLYVLFFPTFLAGPVERFQKFQSQSAAMPDLEWENINQGLIRIGRGLIKKFVLADRLLPYVKPILEHADLHEGFMIVGAICLLSWLIYFDFSGYTDLALGLSRLYGYSIMENFNKPFFQKNIALFWRSWHISVYSWIRDYFFLPLFGFRASLAKIYLGVFLTMVVFMIWHDATINWLTLGVYHGLGLVFYMLYQETKKKYPILRQLHFPGSQALATAATFVFVSIGFLFFYFPPRQVAAILMKVVGI